MTCRLPFSLHPIYVCPSGVFFFFGDMWQYRVCINEWWDFVRRLTKTDTDCALYFCSFDSPTQKVFVHFSFIHLKRFLKWYYTKPALWEYLLCCCLSQGSSPDDRIGAKPPGPQFLDARRKKHGVNIQGQIVVVCGRVVLRCRPPDGSLLGLT